jgi:hypothetical protein
MGMTPKGFITRFSGDTEVAGAVAIAVPRALYAVAFGSKPKKNPPELLPPAVADCDCGIRLKKIEDEKTGIINRPHGSTYLEEKSDNHLAGLRAARESGGVKSRCELTLTRRRPYEEV